MVCRGFYSLHRETYSVTPNPRASPVLVSRFYSLHRETYSVTSGHLLRGRYVLGWFLFAASRDVQRDVVGMSYAVPGTSFYSLHRETYSVTCQRSQPEKGEERFYSLHRETYSVTASRATSVATPSGPSIRCIARRTA